MKAPTTDYPAVLKILGPLAWLYTWAGALLTAGNTFITIFEDQYADADDADLNLALNPGMNLLGTLRDNYIARTATAIQAWCIAQATAFLQSAFFLDRLSSAPTSTSAHDILTEFAAEMTTDTKTITTGGTLKAFLNATAGATLGWPTAADPTPGATYKDSVYVVATEI